MRTLLLATALLTATMVSAQAQDKGQRDKQPRQKNERRDAQQRSGGGGNKYSLEQAMSDKAQLHTIAFNGLAFITGNKGGDTFMPPGKVADFFGFQYMRDVDVAGYGHNTTFLTKAAYNILTLLNEQQLQELVSLAKAQAPLYIGFAYNRYPLMVAFRRSLEGNFPAGTQSLSADAVAHYTAALYRNFDAPLSYERATMFGRIISSFTPEQKATLAAYKFDDYNSWTNERPNEEMKRSMTQVEFVAVMTYASELFSWYKGSLDADIYFCPERHGTYYGGFFMKDYPAMGNPDYFISTSVTGNSGAEFLNTLSPGQRERITSIIDAQRADIQEIGRIRRTVSMELRKAQDGQSIDKDKVYDLIECYGLLDGRISGLYAIRFSEVNQTLTADQRTALIKLRNLDVVPEGGYRFSTPVSYPEVPNTDFLFGVGQAPANQARFDPPASFLVNPQRPEGGRRPKGDDRAAKQDDNRPRKNNN